MTADWSRVRALFEQALDRPSGEREAFVRGAAEGDPELTAEVLALLVGEDEGDGFLDSPIELQPEPTPTNVVLVSPGDLVGAYEVVRPIGSGGMGTVFEATQKSPARTVALKVLRRGLHSGDAVRRFQLEAEVLGRLQHPGIAAIFEAGVHRPDEASPEVPYFALEHVERARDLVSYAREEGLSLRNRLGLFLELVAAVHHAHQKGVIHRDLKPGNVLVGPDGQPKVIDYGVARLTDSSNFVVPTVETVTGGALGTLPYMSPEQLAGDRDGIDVRTDVYGLGAILFELLTGKTPLEIEGSSLADAVRMISDTTPQAPSKLAANIPADLDWIALRALEKESERRYGTAAELGDDVLRYLRQEPVQAGPPTASYRFRKLYGRHRYALTAAAIALLALIGGLVGTTAGLVRARAAEREADTERSAAIEARSVAERAEVKARAERTAALEAERTAAREREAAIEEAAKAREMLDFLADTLAAADPAQAGRELRMVDYLDGASQQIQQRFENRPEIRRHLDRVVGRAWSGLGEIERANTHLSDVLAALRADPGTDDRELAIVLGDLAVVRTEEGRFDEVLALTDEVEAALDRAGLGNSLEHWRNRATRCQARLSLGERDGMEAELRGTLAGLGAAAGPGSRHFTEAAIMLAVFLQEGREFDQAGEVYAAALEPARERWGDEHPLVLRTRSNLAMTEVMLGKRDGPIAELESVLEAMRRVLGPDHHEVIPTMNNLAGLYYFVQRPEDAIELWTESLEVMDTKLPPDHPTLLSVRSNLGAVLSYHGRHDEAEPHLREALAVRDESLGPGSERSLGTRLELARLLRDHGDPDEALELFGTGYANALEQLPSGHAMRAKFEIDYGAMLVERGRLDEAREALGPCREAVESGRIEGLTPHDKRRLSDAWDALSQG